MQIRFIHLFISSALTVLSQVSGSRLPGFSTNSCFCKKTLHATSALSQNIRFPARSCFSPTPSWLGSSLQSRSSCASSPQSANRLCDPCLSPPFIASTVRTTNVALKGTESTLQGENCTYGSSTLGNTTNVSSSLGFQHDGQISQDSPLGHVDMSGNESVVKDAMSEMKTNKFNTLCRIIANSDGKLPDRTYFAIPQSLRDSVLLDKLDGIFHAMAHAESSHLRYFDRVPSDKPGVNNFVYRENELISVLRSSLDQAGFALLNQRDYDLCEALNAGYLLRLSIAPDTDDFSDDIGRKFFPNKDETEPLLFDGRVLVFRRGYSKEITEGRLLLPKLDYLQSSLVQRSAASLVDRLSEFDRKINVRIRREWRRSTKGLRRYLDEMIGRIDHNSFVDLAREGWRKNRNVNEGEEHLTSKSSRNAGTKRTKRIKALGRYGGSKMRFVGTPDANDALAPFLFCEIDEQDYDNKRDGATMESDDSDAGEERVPFCTYDINGGTSQNMSVRMLDRVSISNVVDFFSRGGRRRLVRSFISKSKLVEPTFEEVVVIWRPLRDKKKSKKRSRFVLPRFIYDVAEIFAVDDRLPLRPAPEPEEQPLPLEVRVFNRVQMSNLPAVLPKTRLLFRPGDAFVFDLISLLSLFTLLATQRFDSPQLDIIAIVSVSAWILRTFFRYSNKIARYDLLVKKFLTSKLFQRGSGALKYITNEAGYQRAMRAGLLYTWLSQTQQDGAHRKTIDAEDHKTGLSADYVLGNANNGINEMIVSDVIIDINAGLRDLEDLNLLSCSKDRQTYLVVDQNKTVSELKNAWVAIFENSMPPTERGKGT